MNIELQERTVAHVRIYFEKSQDPEIRAVLHHSSQTVEQAVEAFRQTQLPGAASYGRTIYVDGAYAGDIWCYCIDLNETPNAMLGYCLFEKSLWRKGIVTEALRMFLEDIVPRFGLKTVGAFAYCCNKASLRVMEKNGLTLRETFLEDGQESAYYQKEIEGMP